MEALLVYIADEDARREVSLARSALLLVAAILLHNTEEWFALGLMPETLVQLRELFALPIPIRDLAAVRAGIVAFTAFPLIILWRFAVRPNGRLTFLACMIAAMTATNALVPHLALALAVGSYVPGLASATLLTLPVGLWTLRRARLDRWLPFRQWLAAIAAGIALLPAVLLGFWALGELVAELFG